MPKAENLIGKGNRFSSTNQPANRGRKPSLYKQLLQQWGEDDTPKPTKEDYSRAINHLLQSTEEDLQEIGNDKNTPVWVRSIVSAIREDMQAGRISTINILFDRVFGKPSQSADVDAKLSLRGSIPIRAWVEDRLKQKK